ncbi:MarR family winged helix-turn-helix transcriptional regulator [Aestuariispira insulae]|uniref:DNA-binding MarR family transcriptional regulator n=1 Tax=Aestuariispira insulae TaxID=1461337 RepID=A0A3D9HGC6_9PROT|nr:MarR family winged helix-turn-helix transcriptional regulator [Aestuariispira insulae]RED48552.1 DNA-binding MarR family transcriptional regulator [Aestuariispira insulae]
MKNDLFDPATGACIGLNLRQASRLITSFYDRHMEPSGLKLTQFGLLFSVGDMEKPTINELADRLELDRTTLSRNLKPLEREGWIKVTPGEDKRVRTLTLTPDGAEVLARARPCWEQAQHEAVEIFGRYNWLTMKDRLDSANREIKEILTPSGETSEAAE